MTVEFYLGLAMGLLSGIIFFAFVIKAIQAKLTAATEAKTEWTLKAAALPTLEKNLLKTQTELEQLRQEQGAIKEAKARLESTLQAQKQHSEERLEEQSKLKEQLGHSFENLAQKIFEEKSHKFTVHNKENIQNILSPLSENIKDFKEKISQNHVEGGKERVLLREELKHLKELNHQLSSEAKGLAKALTGDQKVQGYWGEIILEKILESSGLCKDREYETQTHIKNQDGKSYRPDVIIRLPDNKDLVIDAKVSLSAYERYCSADNKKGAEEALTQHSLSVKKHIKGLSSKSYEQLPGLRSPDFVLMFMPVEAAFIAALKVDPNLYLDAFDQNIMLVSPSTLLMTLRTIKHIWRHEYQNQNAQEIAKRAGDLYDKFVGFTDALGDIGDKLEKANKAHRLASDRLINGQGSLVKRVEVLKSLGVKTKKNISEIKSPEL